MVGKFIIYYRACHDFRQVNLQAGLLFIICGFQSTFCIAQNCRIGYEHNRSEILNKNKVKEVIVYSGDEINQARLKEHYFFDASGCPNKSIKFDRFSENNRPAIEEFSLTPDHLKSVYTSSRKQESGALKIYLKESKYFSTGSKILKKVVEEDIDIKNVTISLYDTADYFKVDERRITLIESSHDTIKEIIDRFDLKTKIKVIREKKNGWWNESEKSVTTYKKGEWDEFTFYKNGKVVQNYTRKSIESSSGKKSDNKIIEDEMNNPLPTSEEYADTIYTNDSNSFVSLGEEYKSKSKFITALHYEHGEKKKVLQAEVFFRNTGLLFRKINTYSIDYHEIFEYKYFSN